MFSSFTKHFLFIVSWILFSEIANAENIEKLNRLKSVLSENIQNSIEFSVDLFNGPKQGGKLNRFQNHLSSITDFDAFDSFLESTFEDDFNRSNLKIQHLDFYENETIEIPFYMHGIPFTQDKSKAMRNAFEALEDLTSLHPEVKKLDPLLLRKRLALAFATRSQSFDGNAWGYIAEDVLMKNFERLQLDLSAGDNFPAIQNAGRASYSINLAKDSTELQLSADFVLEVAYEVSVASQFQCHREMTMDLLTGAFSEDKITITRIDELEADLNGFVIMGL